MYTHLFLYAADIQTDNVHTVYVCGYLQNGSVEEESK